MKGQLWLLQIPVILFFSLCFWIVELGFQGNLENTFLREKVYPVVSRPSHFLTDFKFTLRGPRPVKNKIVVIEVDSASIERFGRWPWHRDLTAYLIEKTFLAGAKVVGLDMVFSEPDLRIPAELTQILQQKKMGDLFQKFETDPVLKSVIQAYSNRLVLGWATETACQPGYEEPKFCPVTDPEAVKLYPEEYSKFSIGSFNNSKGFDPQKTPMLSYVTPIANIPEYNSVAHHVGFFSAVLDVDGYIRRTNLFAFAAGRPYPSLALEMARVGLQDSLQLTLDDQFRVKSLGFQNTKKMIPVTPLGSMQVNFRGPSNVFPHISAEDVLSEQDVIQDPMNPSLLGHSKSELLKDAFVLIGLSAIGVFDMRQFPFESNAPGVYGHAHILDNLLSGDPIVPGSFGTRSLWILLLMIFGVSAFAYTISRIDAIPALALTLSVFIGIGYLDFVVLFRNNHNWNTSFLYLEVSSVFILIIAAKYVLEERNKKFIRSAFSKYVAPVVVDSILKDPTKLSLGGEKRETTILFSDIRGFTTFSEKMDAKALAAFLNDYLGIMTGIVFEHQGTLDKYIGDAIMAFWGAPLDQPKHAFNSCRSAVEMMRALEKHHGRFKSQYDIDVKVGIGLNSGVVNVGNMGSEQNFEYTVIGDHVNLASRLEGLTKKYGAGIVTSRFTFDAIQQSGEALPPHRILDQVKVKGKKKAVELIQLLEKEYSQRGLDLFAEGRTLYTAQKWKEAIQAFHAASQLLQLNPESPDGPSQIYLERCKLFLINPPGSDWDGSWEMDSK
jgi:adenylate cyclase